MTDLRRIVRRPSAGTVVVLDVDDQTNYVMVRDSFKVTPPASRPILAARQRRFGGARTVGEIHDNNGAVAWTALIRGTSPSACLDLVEALLTAVESAATDLFFEWKPQSAAKSVFYEIRGPATWLPNYSAMQMQGANSMVVDITIPVAPLAQLDKIDITIASRDWPARVPLPSPIPGNAPALVDVNVSVGTGNRAPWGLLAWAPRPTTSSIAAAPLGVFQGETATASHGPSSSTVVTGSSYFGGRALQADADDYISWQVDPSVLAPDDFSDEIDIEVYARVRIPGSLSGSRLTAFAVSSQINAAGTDRYTAEFGVAGALITGGHSLGNTRTYRLGTLTLPVDRENPSAWTLGIRHSWTSGAAVDVTYDYAFLVPARARATQPTGVELTSMTPLIPSDSGGGRIVRGADLSSYIIGGSGDWVRSSGLGGSPIEMMPGDTDFMMLLSTGVPDGPISDETGDDSVSRTAAVSLTVTPRVWLAKGT